MLRWQHPFEKNWSFTVWEKNPTSNMEGSLSQVSLTLQNYPRFEFIKIILHHGMMSKLLSIFIYLFIHLSPFNSRNTLKSLIWTQKIKQGKKENRNNLSDEMASQEVLGQYFRFLFVAGRTFIAGLSFFIGNIKLRITICLGEVQLFWTGERSLLWMFIKNKLWFNK